MQKINLVIALITVCCTPGIIADAEARAIDEVRAGVSVQSSGPVAASEEDGAAFAAEVLFPSLDFIALLGKPRPHLGLSVATDGDATSFVYAGLTWHLSVWDGKVFFEFGGGGAVHDGRVSFNPTLDRPQSGQSFLGCPVLFRLHGGPGISIGRNWTAVLQFEHLSNANLCSENEGLDNIGLRLGRRF